MFRCPGRQLREWNRVILEDITATQAVHTLVLPTGIVVKFPMRGLTEGRCGRFVPISVGKPHSRLWSGLVCVIMRFLEDRGSRSGFGEQGLSPLPGNRRPGIGQGKIRGSHCCSRVRRVIDLAVASFNVKETNK